MKNNELEPLSMDTTIPKKRGRKPKNNVETIEQLSEDIKKKRGRKKKYEIENFEKILNRDSQNNFNHHVIYSDDDTPEKEELTKKKVSFGNLNIVVSKKNESEINANQFNFKNYVKPEIIPEEYSDSDVSDSEPNEKKIINTKNTNNKYYDTSSKYAEYSEYSEFINKKEQLTLNTELSQYKVKIYTTLDGIDFESDWPQQIDSCCWWCCHSIKGSPCSRPVSYDPVRKRYKVSGIYCSWNCAIADNQNLNSSNSGYTRSLLTMFIKELYGITSALSIRPAGPRQTLKMFGGYKTIEQFREDFLTVQKYDMNTVGIKYVYPQIIEHHPGKLKKTTNNKKLL